MGVLFYGIATTVSNSYPLPLTGYLGRPSRAYCYAHHIFGAPPLDVVSGDRRKRRPRILVLLYSAAYPAASLRTTCLTAMRFLRGQTAHLFCALHSSQRVIRVTNQPPHRILR